MECCPARSPWSFSRRFAGGARRSFSTTAWVLTQPGPDNASRYVVIAILAWAMGLQNILMRRWGIPDLATNLMTLTFAGLHADSTLGGGNNPRALRRGLSILIFAVSAAFGAFLTRYGIFWPILAAFTVFAVALPILLQRFDEPHSPDRN